MKEKFGKLLTRKDINKIISVSPAREKAMVYLIALSGMIQGEFIDLTIGNFLGAASSAVEKELTDVYDMFKHEREILQEILMLGFKKTEINLRHPIFIPPETSRVIISYLKERCFGDNEKIRINCIDDLIFVTDCGKKMTTASVFQNFQDIGTNAGFQYKNEYNKFKGPHSLMDYFMNIISNKSRSQILVDYLLGYHLNNQYRTFTRTDLLFLKKYYIEVLPYLSFGIRDMKYLECKELFEKSKEKIFIITLS